MSTSSKFSKHFQWLLSNKWMRVLWLGLAGFAGVMLLKHCGRDMLDFLDIAKIESTKTDDDASDYPASVRGYFVLPILSIFVVFALWVFRTYDTRQQIEQTNRQLQQTNFAKGMDNLVSNNPLRVEIGVILLMEVSKATSTFDKEIRLAFIKRLKESIVKSEEMKFQEGVSNRLSYAQYIIQWLINHPKVGGKKPDLIGMNCECQEFTADQSHGGTNTKLEMVKILPEAAGGLPKSPSISHEDNPHIPVYHFMWANCENISFKKIDLSRFDFRGAINVNMVGGYIADTTRSPLGVVGTTLFDYIDSETGEVIKNPPVEISGY